MLKYFYIKVCFILCAFHNKNEFNSTLLFVCFFFTVITPTSTRYFFRQTHYTETDPYSKLLRKEIKLFYAKYITQINESKIAHVFFFRFAPIIKQAIMKMKIIKIYKKKTKQTLCQIYLKVQNFCQFYIKSTTIPELHVIFLGAKISLQNLS